MDNAVASPGDWKTLTQACVFLGVSRRTLYNWMGSGQLRYSTMPSGRRIVHVNDLVIRRTERAIDAAV